MTSINVSKITTLRGNYNGNCTITGFLSRLGVMHRSKVYLIERQSLAIIDAAVAQDDGHYYFRFLDNRPYLIFALDRTSSPVNAAISDYVTPEPMA